MARSHSHSRAKRWLLAVAALAAGASYLLNNPAALRATAVAAIGATLTVAWARRRRTVLSRRRLRTLGDLLALTPPQFEAAVADLLTRSSYRRAQLCGGPSDLGADIFCEDRRGRLIVVQCKRHAPGIAVGSGEIQRFMGTVAHHQADRGIFVTTSRFSKPAAELAEQHKIELMDGEALSRLALQLNSGHDAQARV